MCAWIFIIVDKDDQSITCISCGLCQAFFEERIAQMIDFRSARESIHVATPTTTFVKNYFRNFS
jgi:hypothetical protein